MALTSKERLALAICDFLSTSARDGTLGADEKDTIDVAINCIADAFKVNPADGAAVAEAIGSQNLLKIYGVYEKLHSAAKPPTCASSSTPGAAAGPTAETGGAEPSEDDKKKAEQLKGEGNRAMAGKDFDKAINYYTQALALHPGNAIFLSNRAAAYSEARDHESARADAEAAVWIDPKYTKAWSRLGLARFALGDARGSLEAYRQGIEHEGNAGSDEMKKSFETAKRRVEEQEREKAALSSAASRGAGGGAGGASGIPDLGSLASLLGSGGAGLGAGGGMPALSTIMNNPKFASMAQNVMANPDLLGSIMSNPRMRQMAEQFGQGGGMPDLAAVMNDPSVAEMARQLMSGGGGAGGAGAGGAGGAGGAARPGPAAG